MENEKDRVLETLTSPDTVQKGVFDTLRCAKLYPQTPLPMMEFDWRRGRVWVIAAPCVMRCKEV